MKNRSAVVMMTRKCNMSCAHCSVASHPGIKGEPSAEELRRTVLELGEAGVTGIQFTGGEPLLRHQLLFELMELAFHRFGIRSAIVSNGFWGKKPERAEEFFTRLLELGLARLTISYDRFHAKFMGPEPVINILEVARRKFYPVSINITRTRDDSELLDLISPFRSYSNALLRFYDVQPVGLAEELGEELRGQVDGFCSGCEQFTVTDDGRALACNGPSYFEKEDSALFLGRTSEEPLKGLMERHSSDPILDTIRLSGPLKLKNLLQEMPEFQDFPFRNTYSGMCQLCRQITSDPEASEALRRRLAEPSEVALRVAQSRVKDMARKDLWHREAINAVEARRVLFLALSADADERAREIRQVLSRADVDWNRQAEMLSLNGVLGNFSGLRSLLEADAPDFFWTMVKEADSYSSPGTKPVSSALAQWRENDFETFFRLAVTLERSSESERAHLHSSSLGKLALSLLARNGLWLGKEIAREPRHWRERLALELGLGVVSPQPYRHVNLLMKPALHLLTVDGWREMPGQMVRAAASFFRGWRGCETIHGRRETFKLLARDLSKVGRLREFF